jgi:hypothetical protein
LKNRSALKGLDELYRQNKKSDDIACVEFFHQLIAPDDLAHVSENVPTSMQIKLTPSQLMAPILAMGVSLKRACCLTHLQRSDRQSEHHPTFGTSSAFRNSDRNRVSALAERSAGVSVIFWHSKITDSEKNSLGQPARVVFCYFGPFPAVLRSSSLRVKFVARAPRRPLNTNMP